MEKSNSGVIIDYVPKEEPKNNKFTWDTLEKTSSNNIVNEDDIKNLEKIIDSYIEKIDKIRENKTRVYF